MYYWIALTILCCTVGFWLATRYRLDSKAGISLGLSFSILFSSGLYAEFRSYDASLKLVLVVFVTLLCLTFLVLLERKTLIAWLKLACLTFLVSLLCHQVIPNPDYLLRAQVAFDYLAEASGMEVPNLRELITSAEQHAEALARTVTERANTLVEVRRETDLLTAEGDVSRRIGAGTWAIVSGDTLKDKEKRLTEVEILNEEGQVTQVGYLDESDIGLKIILPPEQRDR